MRLRSKLAALTITAAVAVTATAAYAFWSADGSGSGSADAAAENPGQVSISGVAAPDLYPGSTSDVTFTISNSGDEAVSAGIIRLTGVTSNKPLCDTSLYDEGEATGVFSMPSIDGSEYSVPAGTVLDPGETVLPVKGKLTMHNQSFNQDACKDATLTLSFSSTEK